MGQSFIAVDAKLNAEEKTIDISQEITYKNTSQEILNDVYLTDWANSFKDKRTPLAQRFEEEFQRNFYYAKSYERGNTEMFSISTHNQPAVSWSRPEKHPDVIKLDLDQPLFPNEEITFKLQYRVKILSLIHI